MAGLVMVLALGNIAVTFRRSTIPMAFEGRVGSIEARSEKHEGVDDVYLLSIGERTVQIDEAVADLVDEGDPIHKEAWSRKIVVGGRPAEVEVSKDFRRMAIVMPGIVLIALLILYRRRPSPSPRKSGGTC